MVLWFNIPLIAILTQYAVIAEDTIKWKLHDGETLNYLLEQSVSKVSKAGGQEWKTDFTLRMNTKWTVKKVNAGGSAEIERTVDRIRFHLESRLGSFDYDSKGNEDPQAPLGPIASRVFNTVVGKTAQFRIDPQGRVTDLKMSEDMLKTLQDVSAGDKAGSVFSEETWKNILEEMPTLPAEPLSKGKSWSSHSKIPHLFGFWYPQRKTFVPFGTIHADHTITCEGTQVIEGRKFNLGDIGTVLSFQKSPEQDEEFRLVSQTSSGKTYFDEAAGRFLEVGTHQHLVLLDMGRRMENVFEITTSVKLEETRKKDENEDMSPNELDTKSKGKG